MSDTSDDGLCCAEITVATRAYRKTLGIVDHPDCEFVVDVKCENGSQLRMEVGSVEALAILSRSMNPPEIHFYATKDEHDTLVADIRGYVHAQMTQDAMPSRAVTEDASDAHVLH